MIANAAPAGAPPTLKSLRLTGLDGSNPLAFLAAVGLLRVLDHRAGLGRSPRPRLSWIEEGYWCPVLHGEVDVEAVIRAVLEDKETWSDDPALLLAYNEAGEALVDPRVHRHATRDLKPKPAAMRRFLEAIAARAEQPLDPNARLAAGRTMSMAAAYGSELVQDNNGNTKPTAFHFTAGQQRFLDAVARLREGVADEHVREALLGPWTGASHLPSMSWDATVARLYALRAGDPSKERRGSVPGADWLAYIGLGFTIATPVRGQLRTTGIAGGWKNSVFTWPLWTRPASMPVVRSLLATADLDTLDSQARNSRGIGVVFQSGIVRSDQGGYGGFTPARVR
jgi:hypothetical protein